ncbi:MAG: glycosyltransferase family 1 protein [Rhodospirillales bacterium]|nr:glycosyltransferase family 1 protein [Rhodospirillales bacterium]
MSLPLRTDAGPATRPPVRILINALHALSGGGITYLHHMLPDLAADADLELHLAIHESQRPLLPAIDSRIRVHAFAFPNGFYRRLVWEQVTLPSIARRLGIEVTFSPANFGPLLAPRSVLLLRNALAVGREEKRWGKRLYWAGLTIATRLSLWRCRRAIAVSDYARRALAGPSDPRVAVIHHGVSDIFSPSKTGRREGFLLAVSDLYVQKNLHGLLAAVAKARHDNPDLTLKIAGRAVDPDCARQLERDVAALGLGAHVEFLGHCSAADLADLYRRCGLFVFPSLVETFGHPLVEAMASGAPIIASRTTAMPEIVGDAALLVDPYNPDDIAAAIVMALRDDALRRNLSKKALARARSYSWAECARRTAAVLKSCRDAG